MKDARKIIDEAVTALPSLMVYEASLPATAKALRDLFAKCERFFERGGSLSELSLPTGRRA